MASSFEFRLGSDVACAEGSTVGTLVSVLVESASFDPKAIVVRNETSLVGRLVSDEKYLITDDVVIPIASVGSATRDRVQLSISSSDVRRQPPYFSYQWEPITAGQAVLEEMQLLGGGLALPPVDQIANKPADHIEIDRDENVMLGNTGRRLGHVHEVLYEQGEMVGIVIRPDGLFKHDVVLPIRFITRADDMALFADLSESDIANLKPYGRE